ncbi:hypothetical protein CKO16_09375 [Rhodoblastus acidophilus]|nr:hypothetical protein CKO16_09375 [Rhodoblastus acidophilus]
MSALAQNSDAQRFSFVAPSPSYGSSYATRTVVIDTPGPQLGAGGAPALLAVLWWIGRKLSRRQGERGPETIRRRRA